MSAPSIASHAQGRRHRSPGILYVVFSFFSMHSTSVERWFPAVHGSPITSTLVARHAISAPETAKRMRMALEGTLPGALHKRGDSIRSYDATFQLKAGPSMLKAVTVAWPCRVCLKSARNLRWTTDQMSCAARNSTLANSTMVQGTCAGTANGDLHLVLKSMFIVLQCLLNWQTLRDRGP